MSAVGGNAGERRGRELDATVDVVVPAYRGIESLKRCIAGLLAHPQRTPYELVVVDDASPEPELARWLRAQRDEGRLKLLQGSAHAGFAAAVNRALVLHPDRDAVVLHADVEVANDWLDRLAAHAASAADVGTVAPFASSAGVAGYPKSGVRNTPPGALGVAELDALFARASPGAAVQVPVTRGPCIYLRRACIAATGAFDAGPLGGDYGVEQDFALRAAAAGFRHLLAADVFVAHRGAESFGEAQAQELSAHAEQALDKLFPHYAAARAERAQRDPARPYQRRVDLLRLAESRKPLLLFVAHAWGGGVRRHMTELAAMVGERCNALFLEPQTADTVKLHWPADGEGFATWFSLPQDLQALASVLRSAGLDRLHFHHVHGLPRSVLDLPAALGVAYDCTLHDYYAICPQYHLVTEDARYCGEPDAAGCAACLARRPHAWGLDITEWRSAFGRLLRGADRVFAPSGDVARRMARYFPDLKVTILAHPEQPPIVSPRVTRVVTLGNLSPEKGLRTLSDCARDAMARSLPLAFRVLGPTTSPLPVWPQAHVSIHGQYAEGELPTLLAAERPDVIWFPAQVPETYSYTLSVAIASGIPIVAAALGALPERLAGNASALLVPWDAEPPAWNEALLRAGSGARAEAQRPPASRLKVS